MSELGQQLREARLQKGMSLDDVQEMTKIRKRYLEAIEAGDYKVLPGSFYVRAFIKTYAETVGLNPDELLEGHKKDVPAEETEATMEPVIQKRSSRPVERSNRWMSVALMWTFPILIVALLYVYVVMNRDDADTQGVDQTKITDSQQTPNDQPDETKDNGQASTPPDNESAGQETGQGEGEAGGNGGGTDVNGEGTEGQTDEQTPDDTEDQEPADNAGTVTVAEDGKSGNITNFKVNGSTGQPVKVTINASGQSWLEVYKGENSSGEKLQFGMTADGDSLSFDLDSAGLYIKSGYAAATTIEVGGQVVTDGKATNRIRLQLGDESTGTSTGTNTSSVEGADAGTEGSATGGE
ncbi:RodZ family helix-turn-helix domain-containing protein [Paenibacillus sp. ACRRY]|uniref:helix-turn-helix domain-containing protein n=1 Tax=Paenibacillus sp. ACRRY TaxID=2918208 RepID=UPI001EF5C86C|nr:RodZ family helix-turn-helix domain-containing protein [Paenibacillus sp. ACRRY]MCG7382492.1 helix-turn-helix domain-containing protein [Paenibacillus sp. ACRRY]